MSNPEIVKQLRSAAEDALNRGFAIITCLPHDKAPYATYSPNACNSGTRKPEIALKAWNDGHEANYGISCGMSNVTVVDCDHGLQTYEEFIAWRDKNHFPVTLTARSGNTDGYRVHMFYSGAVKTRGFDIDGVTGELKGEGGYVVGAGSIHPSGELYQWIVDEDIQPLPEGLQELAKEKKTLPDIESGKLIPAGNRWGFLQQQAGKLLNMYGPNLEDIEDGLWRFLKTRCEDGANYPPEKVAALAKAFSEGNFSVTEPTVIVFGEGQPLDATIPNLDDFAIGGDWIGEMTKELSQGTPIPPAFVRATIKTILGESVDKMVGFPYHTDLHMRHWNMLIAPAQSGKGESWKRLKWALPNYMKDAGLMMADSGWYSSGEHITKKFLDNGFEHQRVLTQFDEMRLLFEKGSAQSNSTLLTRLLELYESATISAGSLSNEGGSLSDLSLSMTGGFTPDSFRTSLSGKGVAGDGFLSRCVLSYCEKKNDVDDWAEMNGENIHAIEQKMQARWQEIHDKACDKVHPERFIPDETDAAFDLRRAFQKWLKVVDKEDLKESGSQYTARLEDYFKRDLLLRVLFSDDPSTITADAVNRSVAWAKHEIYLRRSLWPADSSNPVSQLCITIRRTFRLKDALTKKQIMDACHVHRTGHYTEFDKAFKSMLGCGALYIVGNTHKKTDIFGLSD